MEHKVRCGIVELLDKGQNPLVLELSLGEHPGLVAWEAQSEVKLLVANVPIVRLQERMRDPAQREREGGGEGLGVGRRQHKAESW
jgi:hypothetical protein